MNENKIYIFQHIPKTAGSTLQSILKKQYDSEELYIANRGEMMISKLNDLSKNEWEKIKCLNGHVLFGIHEHLSNRPFEYYTMLRDPVEHVISEYYFILRKPNNLSHNIVKNMSFEEFITSEQFKGRTSNRQTFFVSGGVQNDINLAKKNLENYYAVVGITEMFEESLYLIVQELGWKNYRYKKRNVTIKRPLREDFPEEVIEIIMKNNKLDIELYNFGMQLMEEKIQNLSPESKKNMEHFIANTEKK
ncbi:sulfotransferase family 2 domain-containing protein [Neobacillus ginsengisoli]|uniref:Sulfotransferase family protein n=1 Tax=Neobacillus ginsengisoli TaxID=904295 RepID=A0ABT9XXB6_9BACI|nr:sulfotransferase family 2 domain-containing protein [Neobacillus ginsengisoli]MDQ0200223.1 hypothetical protein [Neobacillus ginsengisoli]